MALPMKKAAMKAMKAAAMKKGMKAAMKKAVMKMGMKAAMKKAAMKKGMKAAMKKAMKQKAMKKSAIAKGVRAKLSVFSGSKKKTGGGLTKDKLTKSKSGKIVSKALSLKGKRQFAKSPLKKWSEATKKARKELGIKGFVPVGGKSAKGKQLLAKVREILGR